jgi:tryptophanyl-tRNA synthetase
MHTNLTSSPHDLNYNTSQSLSREVRNIVLKMPKIKIPSPRIVFSGIQPTGVPHLGNYVGALRQWVQLQHSEPDTKLIYSIVDLHAITMPQPPEQLRTRKREALAALLAIGIDPERATLFYQSSVSVVLYFC